MSRGLKHQKISRKQAETEPHQACVEASFSGLEGIAKLKQANARLERTNQDLRDFAGHLIHLQDEEHRRCAHELHDGITQNLIALSMIMARLRKQLPLTNSADATLFFDSRQLIDQSIKELRSMSQVLHPPLIDEVGIEVTLRSYAEGFSARSGIHVDFEIEPNLGRMNGDMELGIFRIIEESLANIWRHSGAHAARVTLVRDKGTLSLEISDDGKGFPPNALGRSKGDKAAFGIESMRERVRLLGGRFEVLSSQQGTTVRVVFPVGKETAKNEYVHGQCNPFQ